MAYLDQTIPNPQFRKMVKDHLKSVKPNDLNYPKNKQALRNFVKWMYNKKVEEEQVLKLKSRPKLYDESLKDRFGSIPNNCLHIRSSFYTWRVKR